MAFYKTKGIIIKRTPSGEANLIITIFSEDLGKIKVIGRGVRRITSKLANELELFNYTDFLITHGKSLDVITGAFAIKRFRGIKGDLKKVSLTKHLADLVEKLTAENHQNKEIFSLLKRILVFLDHEKREFDMWTVARNFEWKFLKKNGLEPKLYHCSLCHKKLEPENIFLEERGHGFVCFNCGKNKNLKSTTIETIKILRLFAGQDFKKLSKIKLKPEQKKETKKALQYFLDSI